MKSQFLTELDIGLCPSNEGIWWLRTPLVYYSGLLKEEIVVPPAYIDVKFYTDLASVPRIPIIYELWGNRAHTEAVIHDFLFCKNSTPSVSFTMANRVFLEAMQVREKPFYISYPMFTGVMAFSYPSFHRRNVEDDLTLKKAA